MRMQIYKAEAGELDSSLDEMAPKTIPVTQAAIGNAVTGNRP